MSIEQHPRDLAFRAREGDRSAFDSLVERYSDRLTSLAHARLGDELARHIDADDILQESLLKAFQSIERFEWRGGDSFVRWIGVIVERSIQDAARRFRARPAQSLEVDVADSVISPSKAERRHERFDRFEGALEQLRPDYREAVLLARIDGLPIEEVARRMNRSPNAVSHLLLRALRKLREILPDTQSLRLPDRRLNREGGSDDD